MGPSFLTLSNESQRHDTPAVSILSLVKAFSVCRRAMIFCCPLALVALFLGAHAAEDTATQGARRASALRGSPDSTREENNTQAVRRLSDAYKFDLNIRAGPGVTITGDGFKGDDAIYGCGNDNRKCQCLYPADGFRMLGYGSENTWTGLEFSCKNIKFSMPGHSPEECTCSFKAMINYWGKGRDFVMECSSKERFRLVDYDGQGSGTVHDLNDRFKNPAGGGHIKDTDWEFHAQADALGEAKPKKPDAILGGWQPVSSGASTTVSQEIHWSSTSTRADEKDVSSSFTAGTKYTYSQKGGITVPELADAESTASLEVSMSRTEGWKSAVTDTYSKTQGGSQTFECKPQPCEGGTSYQWQTSVLHEGKWGALFDSCNFFCMPNQGERPKCPYGSCCSSKDLTDQCSKCSVEWCDKADPNCPFHDPNFKAGCD